MNHRRTAALTVLLVTIAVVSSGCDLSTWISDCANSIDNKYSGLMCMQLGGAIGGGILALLAALLGIG